MWVFTLTDGLDRHNFYKDNSNNFSHEKYSQSVFVEKFISDNIFYFLSRLIEKKIITADQSDLLYQWFSMIK